MKFNATVFVGAITMALLASVAEATPQFARKYRVDCSACHSAPPKLTQPGEDFRARGYRFDDLAPLPSHPTAPVAVWNTYDVEYRDAQRLTKAFPSRIEIITGGTIGQRVSYFAELRALSQSIGAGNRLLNRSGRFEDLFATVGLDRRGSVTLTMGQFRTLNQVDVSLRIGLSEPLALSAGIPDARPASTPRLTSLRGFSPSARQPAVRVMYHRLGGTHAADGWYSALTLPLVGELTIPLTEAASFEFEARPKGIFGESYLRRGMTSIGGHFFAGNRRGLGNAVLSTEIGARWAVLAAAGFDRTRGLTQGRFSVGGEFHADPITLGARVDHRTRQRRDPVVLAYANAHLPFGPARFRQAFRVQFEQTIQRKNMRSGVALSHVF